MAKQYFLANSDDGKAAAFEQFRDNIAPFAAAFGITAAELSQQAADATYFRNVLNFTATMLESGQQWSSWRGVVLYGGAGSEPASPAKRIGFPSPVPPGILGRFVSLVSAIKNHRAYTPAIGKILGIEGVHRASPDLSTIQPTIDAELIGGQILIRWGWGGNRAFLEMLEIQVDRGDGKGWVMLAIDTTPNYTDTFPLPEDSIRWMYRAIYRVGSAQVGVWSNTADIIVGGYGSGADRHAVWQAHTAFSG